MFLGLCSSAQLITNSGKEFWFAFPETFDKASAVYWVNITSNDSTGGTVSIPGLGWSQTFSVLAGQVVRVNIPSAHATNIGSHLNFNKAIKILANDDVVAYAITYHAFRHEASLIIPNKALGDRYRPISYKSEIKGGQLYESEFCVVAAGDTVVVEITPKCNLAGGLVANTTYTRTVLPGEVYQVQAASSIDDISGSLVRSTNGKKFAVYSGNVWSTVVCTPNSDPLLEAMFPTNTWGKDYFVIPTPNVNLDYIKIIADSNSTMIYRNGIFVATINAGQFYQDNITTHMNYTSNKPIALAHFLVTGASGCTSYINTDPSMIMCNATEQMFLDSISFFAVDTSAIDSHYVHIITRTADIGTVYLDNSLVTGWTTFYQNTSYSFKTVNVTAGYHRLETGGCGFIAYSMGIGRAVSYGYATGASLIDLDNSVTYSNFLNGSDTICQNDTVSFQSLIKGTPISFKWHFGDGDSSTLQNPRHSYSSPGYYPISAKVVYSCLTDILFDTIYVPPTPVVDLGPDTALCNSDSLGFSVNTHLFSSIWSDGSTDSFLLVNQPGTYWAHVYNYCGSGYDTVQIDSLYPDSVYLGIDTLLCVGDSITFDISAVHGSSYLWSDGSLDSIKKGAGGQTLWAEVSNVCGVFKDTIELYSERVPEIEFGNDTVLCDGQSLLLNAYFSRSSILWQDGSTFPFRTVNSPGGKYYVAVDNICGSVKDTITIEFDYPQNPFLGQDTVICTGDTVLLDPETNGAFSLWQNGISDTVFSVFGKGKYWIELRNACGVYSDTVLYTEEGEPSVQLPADTIICTGQTLSFDVSFFNSKYLWNTGDTSPIMVISTPNNYVVTVTNICGTATDDIFVTYDKPLQVNLGPDTLLCDNLGFEIELNVPNSPHYEWSTGETGNKITIQNSGTYSVRVVNKCGGYTDDIKVISMYIPEINLGPDRIICSGSSTRLSAGLRFDKLLGVKYSWNNGRRDSLIEVETNGQYILTAFNTCGTGSDTIDVQVNKIPSIYISDTILCYGDYLVYDFDSLWGYSFLWNGITENNNYTISEPGEYWVRVSDSAGCGSNEYFEILECPIPLWVPNAFTPNGDGDNDLFRAYKADVYDFSIQVIDQWGHVIFSSNDINYSWDGSVENDGVRVCPIGTYIWKITFKEFRDNQLQVATGTISLIR